MGGLGGNKSADNTDVMRENESDSRRTNRGGGLGAEAMKDEKIEIKPGEGRSMGSAAEFCKNGKMRHIK